MQIKKYFTLIISVLIVMYAATAVNCQEAVDTVMVQPGVTRTRVLMMFWFHIICSFHRL